MGEEEDRVGRSKGQVDPYHLHGFNSKIKKKGSEKHNKTLRKKQGKRDKRQFPVMEEEMMLLLVAILLVRVVLLVRGRLPRIFIRHAVYTFFSPWKKKKKRISVLFHPFIHPLIHLPIHEAHTTKTHTGAYLELTRPGKLVIGSSWSWHRSWCRHPCGRPRRRQW